MPANACRHFLGMYPDPRPQCAMGRNVRAWAKRCNGGSELGIGLRLPCTKQADDAEKPLFDCPELCRKTDAEIEESRAEMRAQMDRLVSNMAAFSAMKRKMIANDLATAKATCPMCGAKDAMRVSVALEVNNHMRAQCSACGEGFIE